MKPTLSTAAHRELDNIAKTILNVDTLTTRNADSLDFHETAVWSLKDALEAAYLAGLVDHHRTAAATNAFARKDVVTYCNGRGLQRKGEVQGYRGDKVIVLHRAGYTVDVQPELLTRVGRYCQG